MANPVLEALRSPLEKLSRDYEAAIGTLGRLAAELRRVAAGLLEDDAPPRQATRAASGDEPSAPPVRPRSSRLEVAGGDIGDLLELQERLAMVPGIRRVTVTGLNEERPGLLVELGDDPDADARTREIEEFQEDPAHLCAWCGRVIGSDGGQVSHGLCAECVDAIVQRMRARPRGRAQP